MKMTWAEAVEMIDTLKVHPKIEWAPEDLDALEKIQEHGRKQNPEEYTTIQELEDLRIKYSPTFRYITTNAWKYYPDGTDADTPYLKENLTDYDPNEDHICGFCGKDLGGRFLFCNKECEDKLFSEEEE